MYAASTTALLKQTYAEWSEDKGPRLGAALAYYAIFSIPPLMIIAIAVIGFVYSGNVIERLQAQLATLIGDDVERAEVHSVLLRRDDPGLALPTERDRPVQILRHRCGRRGPPGERAGAGRADDRSRHARRAEQLAAGQPLRGRLRGLRLVSAGR